MMYAPTKAECDKVMDSFITEHQAKYEKATKCLDSEREKLLTDFDFPAQQWLHLRTTNVIESPFATVRMRERVTKGTDSRTKGLLMAYKLLDMDEKSWRRLNGAELLPQVRLGVRFVDGTSQERDQQATQQPQTKTTKGQRPAA